MKDSETKTNKKGLILEGGAMRGMFTCGVLDVLMENGIVFDGAVGVSAGAAFGCNYKSKQIGRAIRYNIRFCKDPRFCSLRSLVRTGDLFGAEFCYRTLPERLDVFDFETFQGDPMDFYAVSTDIRTGKPYYHKCADGRERDLDYIRASASIPVLSRPVSIDGRLLLDGGLSDPIPIRFFERLGYEKNVLVLTHEYGYRQKKELGEPFVRTAMRKHPRYLRATKDRHLCYNETLRYIERKESKGEVFVLRPRAALTVGAIEHDARALKKAYLEGRAVAKARLSELCAFLKV